MGFGLDSNPRKTKKQIPNPKTQRNQVPNQNQEPKNFWAF